MGSSQSFYILFLALMPCTHSCSIFLLEGNGLYSISTCCQAQDQTHGLYSASSSDPSVKPKKLDKRPRPHSYQEESSPEASPPRGSTPDETECLKMYPPMIHTNQEIMNYSKEDHMNVMHLHNKPCYSSSKERGTDERFWAFFHQDW
jgi:hypothetical protein